MPDVSLIIPCFNHAGSLHRAAASGLAQGRLREIIIVDDCSTDESFALATALASTDPRIRAIRVDYNMGPGAARNAGARIAEGSHLCFLDADDELLEDFFIDAFNLMAGQLEMRSVKGEMEFFDPIKGYILPNYDARYAAAVLSSSCGLVLERDAFSRLGGFPEDSVFRGPFGGEDVAFMQAVIEHFQPIGRIGRPCYRVWSQSGSHVDKFLANTRITETGFEYVRLHSDQEPGGPLSKGLANHLTKVAAMLAEKR